MTWTRTPMAAMAAGHDAVVEVTASVIDQVLARQAPITLPPATAGPYSVDAAASPAGSALSQWTGSLGGGRATTAAGTAVGAIAVVLNVAPASQSALNFVAASAIALGRDVLIRLMLRNDTGGEVLLAASPTLGAMPRPMSAPSQAGAGATVTLVVPVANVPTGTFPIEIRVFDVQAPLLQTRLLGTLALTPDSAAQALVPTVATNTGSLPSLPGLETRVTRARTVTASAGRFGVDLDASTGAELTLSCAVTLAIETSEVTTVGAGGWRSQFGFGPVDTQYTVTRRTGVAALQVKAPLLTAVEPATRAVAVGCDLTAAVVSMSSADADVVEAIPELEHQFQTLFAAHVAQRAPGPRVDVTPRLSLIGTLRPGETVNEVSIQGAAAHILPAASASAKPALAVTMSLAGNARPLGMPHNFVGSGDYAAVVSQAVVQAVARFRWRVGDHPSILAGRAFETEYDDHGTRVPLLVFPQMRQTSLSDGNTIVASISQSGPVTYGTSTGQFTFLMTDPKSTTKAHPEDYVLLGGRGDFEIAAVLRRADMQPAPDEVRNSLDVPPELKGVLFKWPFAMSGIGTPAPVADANLEGFLQAMRTGVTRHLSRPFAEPHTAVLSYRNANAIDGYLLSRGSLTL